MQKQDTTNHKKAKGDKKNDMITGREKQILEFKLSLKKSLHNRTGNSKPDKNEYREINYYGRPGNYHTPTRAFDNIYTDSEKNNHQMGFHK